MAYLTPNTVCIYVGDTHKFQITVYDEDLAVVDITGAAITWKLASSKGGASVLTLSVGVGITITSPTNGQYDVDLSQAQTGALAEGIYYWESEVTIAATKRVVAIGYIDAVTKIS